MDITEVINLAGSITRDEEKKIKAKSKAKSKAKKPPIYTGVDAVDMSKYLK